MKRFLTLFLKSHSDAKKQQNQFDLYNKLAIAEKEIQAGAEGEDFLTFAHIFPARKPTASADGRSG